MRGGQATLVGITAVAAVLTCTGCGFKGPLYLPERNATVVTHPRQTPAKNKGKTAQPSQPAQPSSSPPAPAPASTLPTPPQ